MDILLNVLLFVLGFGALIKGGDILVAGASSIARRFGVPSIVIGLTIVAFGTSAPELFVNIFAATQGSYEIAFGNILGSNISNTFLILGVAAVMYPLALQRNTIWKEIPLSLLAAILLAVMVNDAIFDARTFSELSRIDGVVLISFFIVFLYYTFGMTKIEGTREVIPEFSLPRSSLMVIGGIVLLALGGDFIVDSARFFALLIGISEAVIGLTIVAVGSSLPELVTCIVAGIKKEADIGIGNIVGSNIFNILFVLGITSLIQPLPFTPNLQVSMVIAVFAAFSLFGIMFIERKHMLSRMKGAAFIAAYVLYISYTVFQSF